MGNPNLWLIVGVVIVIAIVYLIQYSPKTRKIVGDLRKKL